MFDKLGAFMLSFTAKQLLKYFHHQVLKFVLDMIDAITAQFIDLGYVDESIRGNRLDNKDAPKESILRLKAESIAQKRGYPTSLANRTTQIHGSN